MLAGRNLEPLSEDQIANCEAAWQLLCGGVARELDTTEADRYGSRTRYNEERRAVILGADAYPGVGINANARMSMLACLAHELAHAERHEAAYGRPFDPPDSYLDEAETSIRAAFNTVISRVDREHLIEDARDRLVDWLAEVKEA